MVPCFASFNRTNWTDTSFTEPQTRSQQTTVTLFQWCLQAPGGRYCFSLLSRTTETPFFFIIIYWVSLALFFSIKIRNVIRQCVCVCLCADVVVYCTEGRTIEGKNTKICSCRVPPIFSDFFLFYFSSLVLKRKKSVTNDAIVFFFCLFPCSRMTLR